MRVTLLSVCLVLVAQSASAQIGAGRATPGVADADSDSTTIETRRDLFFDPQDGQVDLSGFLATRKGFLPLGNVITEPAVGYGGVLGLLFLHDSIANRAAQAAELNPDGTLKRMSPPSASGVAGFLTENGSWGAGGFHNGIFMDDRLRSLSVIFYNELELEFFGRGGEFLLPIDKIEYSLDGTFLMQQFMARVADTDVFIGLNYKFASFDNQLKLDTDLELPEFITEPRNIKTASAGMAIEYDSRNTTFTPDKGLNGRLEGNFFEEALGSDRSFFKGFLKLRGWVPLQQHFVVGLRWDTGIADEDTPFYMLPSIDQRGISLSRYQGQYTTVTEAELRWDLNRRWSLLGFFGSGWTAATDLDQMRLDEAHMAGGTGFRYLISRVFGIRTGVDFAWSEDDFAFYIVTGTAWGQK
jgi:hypothetical protein